MNGAVAHLWNFGTGETFATLDLGQARNFLAWGSVTFADSLWVYDRDNGVAVEVWSIDGNVQWHAGTGGDHLGPDGASTNLRPGGVRAFGRFVTFRLRTFHVSDLEHYGVGCVLTLD